MDIICHRRNTIEELNNTPRYFGVEIDVRSHFDKLILHHDPFKIGISFEDWIENYNHKFLIINIKEEGIEKTILKIIKKRKIEKFFFLDQSFPFLIKTLISGEKRTAIRVSEFESFQTAINLKGKVDWIWLDFFNRFALNESEFKEIIKLKFKLCIVSPELNGKSYSFTESLIKELKDKNYYFDSVCTKFPNLWNTNFD